MLRTDWQKKICEKYSKRIDGKTQCNHCPLVVDRDLLICKGNSHYNYKKHKWMPDEVIK